MELESVIPKTYTGPGLVDLQLNGFAGVDFNAEAAGWTVKRWHTVRSALHKHGVLHALPTFITNSPESLVERAATYRRFIESDNALAYTFPGLHIEGPFISPEEGPRGAHPGQYCQTPARLPDLIDRLQEASGGRIRLFTLAPELDGAMMCIEQCVAQGIVVAIGHTNAKAEVLEDAVAAGARLSTHLGNGSHQVLPRLDNYVQRQLANDRLRASFIADGHHVPFPTLKNFLRAKTFGNSILVTDAIAAAGAGPGTYRLGDSDVVVDDSLRCQIPGQQNLAGSALTLDHAVYNVARYCGVPFESAWAMASTQPAALIGLAEPDRIQIQMHDLM